MRIITQKYLPHRNLPYEGVGLKINRVHENLYEVIAFSLNSKLSWKMAKYSTMENAMGALNGLNDTYVEYHKNIDHEGRQQVYQLDRTWKFPEDKGNE